MRTNTDPGGPDVESLRSRRAHDVDICTTPVVVASSGGDRSHHCSGMSEDSDLSKRLVNSALDL